MTYRRSMSDAIREVQESTIKPYVSISSSGQYNVLDKDSKVVFSTKDGKVANDYLKKNYDKLKEEVVAAEISLDEAELSLEEDVSLQEVSDNLKLAVLKRKIKQYKDKVFKKTMSTIKSPLFAGYEEVEEGRMKDIFTAGEQGKSAEEIALSLIHI